MISLINLFVLIWAIWMLWWAIELAKKPSIWVLVPALFLFFKMIIPVPLILGGF